MARVREHRDVRISEGTDSASGQGQKTEGWGLRLAVGEMEGDRRSRRGVGNCEMVRLFCRRLYQWGRCMYRTWGPGEERGTGWVEDKGCRATL